MELVGNEKRNVVFLGTNLPRECGIATFTQDLLDEFKKIPDFNAPRVIAVNNNKQYDYDEQVIIQIDQHTRSDYTDAANHINDLNTDLVIIQHEFGIYGGESGEFVIDFAERLKVPYIVVFHTILMKPTPKQHDIMCRLAKMSEKVITMAESTIVDLTSIYAVPLNKIEFTHHGVPFIVTETREELQQHYGYENRIVMSTFGFLSPGKGIEYAIEAIHGVAVKYPEIQYIIWGKTHPVVKEETGEVYRQKLQNLVSELGLDNNVTFVDKLLTKEEVIQSLVMSNIYMTPYIGKDQAVSGTLAYGVGYGRVIISTPYRYAVEMLAEGRGLLAQFQDSSSLESCILELLGNPEQIQQMEEKTLALGRTMMWSEIAKKYAALVREISNFQTINNGSVKS